MNVLAALFVLLSCTVAYALDHEIAMTEYTDSVVGQIVESDKPTILKTYSTASPKAYLCSSSSGADRKPMWCYNFPVDDPVDPTKKLSNSLTFEYTAQETNDFYFYLKYATKNSAVISVDISPGNSFDIAPPSTGDWEGFYYTRAPDQISLTQGTKYKIKLTVAFLFSLLIFFLNYSIFSQCIDGLIVGKCSPNTVEHRKKEFPHTFTSTKYSQTYIIICLFYIHIYIYIHVFVFILKKKIREQLCPSQERLLVYKKSLYLSIIYIRSRIMYKTCNIKPVTNIVKYSIVYLA
jgi:hypothetical protein